MNRGLFHFLVRACALLSTIAISDPSGAQDADPDAEIVVCSSPHLASSTQVTGDGSGGVLITWVDYRVDTQGDIYLQRIDSQGSVQWSANGVPVCSAVGAQTRPAVVADGSGGAYVAWQDARGTDLRVYLQRIDHAGLPSFASDGLQVCTSSDAQLYPAIAGDGVGGAFVAWLDSRSERLGHYAQRVDLDGALLWSGEGVVIDTSLGTLAGFPPMLLAAEQGQVIALTQELGELRVRKFGEQGQSLWSVDGVAPCASCVPSNVRATPDGLGGAGLAWTEQSPAAEYRVVAQRISSDGDLQWGDDGLLVFANSARQDLPAITASGDGGAYVVWRHFGFANPRIFAQRLAPDGAKLWGEGGVRAATFGREQGGLVIAEGGSGDLLMLWQMFFESVDYDMFIQRLDGAGAARWQPNGARLPTHSRSNQGAHIVSDGAGGATVVWEGVRSGVATISAERINRLGFAGPLPSSSAGNAVFLWSPAPNPTDGAVTIRVVVRSTMRLTLDVMDVSGRHVSSIANDDVDPGLHSFGWNGKDDQGSLSPSGVYFIRCTSPSGDLMARVQIVR